MQKQRKKIIKRKTTSTRKKRTKEVDDELSNPKLKYNYKSDVFKAQQQRRKNALIKALVEHFGIVSIACKAAGTTRKTFYKYYRDDPEFKARADEVQDYALDHAESQLHRNIMAGKEISLLFYLKCKGKSRGYIEKGDDATLVVNVMPSTDLSPESIV